MSPAVLLMMTVVGAGALPSEPVLTATRVTKGPTIDGDLSDPIWVLAQPAIGFRQIRPYEGAAESGRTEVRMLYDDVALYFSIRVTDPNPDEVVANLCRRDDWAWSDNLEVDIDTQGDHQRAFTFEVSAANVQREGIRTGDWAVAYEWDAVWSSAAHRTSEGWSAEIAIPFTSLRYSNPAHPDWRIQFRRYRPLNAETDLWVFIPRDVRGQMQRYARIAGLDSLPHVHGVVLQPFVMGKIESDRAPADVNVPKGTWPGYGLGLDARYSLTPSLSLIATVLPDFGQVDADPAVLNLTRFETYQTERRPFFLEGADLFELHDANGNALGTQLFYSRRLGAAPTAPYLPIDANGNSALELRLPDVTQIWSAAKVTGRIGDHLNVALLDGVTSSESAQISLPNGPQAAEGVVPLSNFLVGRLRATLGGNLTLGATATSVNRDEQGGSIGIEGICPDTGLPAANKSGRCTHDAQSFGTDVAWQTKDGGWLGAAAIYGSRIAGGPALALADGSVIQSGSRDLGGRAEFTKTAGNLIGSVIYQAAGPKLDLNDAGYLRQQNFQQLYAMIGWHSFNFGPTTDIVTELETWLSDSWNKVNLGRYFQLSNNIVWRSRWHIGTDIGVETRAFDNRDTEDGALTERPAYVEGSIWGSSPYQKKLAFSAWLSGHNNWHGGSIAGGPSLMVKAGSRVNFSLGEQFSINNGDPRWVATNGTGPDREYVMGAQNSATLSSTLRGTIGFTNTITLQAYAQLFFASVDYTGLYQAQPVGQLSTVFLKNLQTIAGDPHYYDSLSPSLNLNVVFRWEYRPGSVFYLVYTRYTNGSLAPLPLGPSGDTLPAKTFDWAALRQGSTQDVVEAKIAYYWGK